MFNKVIAILLFFLSFPLYAEKPIRIVIPFGVGGLVDNANRRLQESLVNELGRPITVDPRPGAAGYIGLKHIATTKTDEVLITVIDAMAVANAILYHGDISKDDFRYIGQLGITTSVAIAVRKDSPLKKVDAWKLQGRPITVGINGIGGAHHYYSWLFENQANLPVTYIPYKGVTEMLNNLIGGHIDAGWANLASLEPHERAGKIDIIAVVHSARAETMPHIPTFGELGIKTPSNAKWLIISNDTKDLATLRQIENVISKLVNNQEFIKIMRTTGIIIEPNNVSNAQESMLGSIKQQAKFIEYIKTKENK